MIFAGGDGNASAGGDLGDQAAIAQATTGENRALAAGHGFGDGYGDTSACSSCKVGGSQRGTKLLNPRRAFIAGAKTASGFGLPAESSSEIGASAFIDMPGHCGMTVAIEWRIEYRSRNRIKHLITCANIAAADLVDVIASR